MERARSINTIVSLITSFTTDGWRCEKLAEFLTREFRELFEVVEGLDAADGPRPGAHDDRVGDGPVARQLDTAKERAVRDARGGDEDVVSGYEIVGREHFVEVVAIVEEGVPLLVVS